MTLAWSATPDMLTTSVDAGTISAHFKGNDAGFFVLTVFCLDDVSYWQIEYGVDLSPLDMLLQGESPNQVLALLDVTIALFTRVREIVAEEQAHA